MNGFMGNRIAPASIKSKEITLVAYIEIDSLLTTL